MIDIAQIDPAKLDELSADQLRELTRELLARTERDGREIGWRDAKIDKLTFEIAQLKRMKFDRSSEQLSAEQRALFDEAVDGDIAAIDEQLAAERLNLRYMLYRALWYGNNNVLVNVQAGWSSRSRLLLRCGKRFLHRKAKCRKRQRAQQQGKVFHKFSFRGRQDRWPLFINASALFRCG